MSRLQQFGRSLTFLCLAGIAMAQDAPSIRVSSRLVVLDIVVTDKAGSSIGTLTKDDFTVLEDEIPQKIVSFEPPAQHVLSSGITMNSTRELEQKAPDMPVDVIVLDELNTRFEDTAYARYAINKYIKAQPMRLNQPTELIAVSEKRFQVLHDYTRDGAALLRTLNQHLTAYPWNLTQGNALDSATERLSLSIAALEQVAEATSGHPGRKNLVWIGRGFPGVVLNSLSDAAKISVIHTVRQMVDMLQNARITLYTIDPTALASPSTMMSNPFDLSELEDATGSDPFGADIKFTLLAPATGGVAFFSRNDVDRELGTSIRDGGNYYTISYSPTNQSDESAQYRRISVKVNQPGLLASTRNGYYSTKPTGIETSSRNQLIFDLSSALASNLKYTGITVTVARSSKGTNSFTLYIDPAHLDWSEPSSGKLQAHMIVEAGSFGKTGKLIGQYVRQMGVEIAASDLAGSSKRQLEVPFVAEIPIGASRIRFVVRDSKNGRMGTVDAVADHSKDQPGK